MIKNYTCIFWTQLLCIVTGNTYSEDCNNFLLHSTTIQHHLENKTSFENLNSNNQQLKFVSYNIQLSGLDNENHLWKDRKHAVSTLLSYADLCAIQEITYEQLVDLKTLLPSFEFVGYNTVTGKSLNEYADNQQEGLVIAFRKDIFSLQSSHMLWYSDTPNIPSQHWGIWKSAFPKALQKATLTCQTNKKEIIIFNSHFAHDEDPSGVINPRVLSSILELKLLHQHLGDYWISAGDRNFHYPRDTKAYDLYAVSDFVCDSRKNACVYGSKTTFMGYEDHPRVNPVSPDGDFEKAYYLDVAFHNPSTMQSTLWISHIGEYDDALKLLPVGPCKQPDKRLFASDHAAIYVTYILDNFLQ